MLRKKHQKSHPDTGDTEQSSPPGHMQRLTQWN